MGRQLNQARITAPVGISELHGDCAANLDCPPFYFGLQVDTTVLEVLELKSGKEPMVGSMAHTRIHRPVTATRG